MELAVGTAPGIRQRRNEDAYLDEPVGGSATLVGVADGFGIVGKGAGSARHALDSVREFLTRRYRLGGLRPRLAPNALRGLVLAAFEHANARLFSASRSDDDFVSGGASLTAALVMGRHAFIGHVGDTRAYLQRMGHLEPLTADDAVFPEPLTSARRAVGAQPRGLLWRSLGTQPKLEASVAHVELLPGDQLVLCTDGVHRCVSDDEINQTLELSVTAAEAVARVLALAKMRGNLDNATVIVARDMLACSPVVLRLGGSADRNGSAIAALVIVLASLLVALFVIR
jgi:serine/threonine protein phosphatase PrpC